MNPVIRLARPGYVLALLALTLGLAFLITGSAEGALVVALLEGAFWACLQYFKARPFKDRRGKRPKPLS
jgi:uncharacterized membrane protein